MLFLERKKYLNKRFSNLQKNMAKIRKYRLWVPKVKFILTKANEGFVVTQGLIALFPDMMRMFMKICQNLHLYIHVSIPP